MLAAASMIAIAQAASAQQAARQEPQASTPTATQAIRKFEPAFFAVYNPVTAFDMVRQVPGFSIDNGDALRGFGATAGNILINGQRPSSKNSISDELTRISARDVARIEIIGAAAAGDVDVRGYTELANVILKPTTGTQESTTWRGDLAWQGEHVSERLSATRSWKTKDLTIRLNAQLTNQGQREETDIVTRNALGVISSTRDEFSQQYFGEFLINGTLNWTPTPQDTVNLTGRLTPRTFQRNFGSKTHNASGVLTQVQADDYTEKDILHAELGGDWEHRLSPEHSAKLIVVNRAVSWRPQELFEAFAPSGTRTLAQEINTELKTGEHVVRGVWTWKPNSEHTIEAGLEGAFNYRDQHRSVANNTGAGFVPQFLPVATTRVEETRAEGSITDTWRVDPALTLELGFTYEASTITQSGDAVQERDFTYPKPRAVATWLPTKEDQLRLSVERTVAQLDFSEFASVIVPIQNQLTVGNPDLEPAQTWETQLQWKRPIGERGSISITAFYHDIEDVQDFIPVRLTTPACLLAPANDPACVFTAAGNIGEGTRWGGRIEATLPLEGVGIKGGVLKITAGGRDTSVTDPITGEKRVITNQLTYDWNIDFRQDIPELKLAWGGDYSNAGDAQAFRLNEEQTRSSSQGDLDMFIETTMFQGFTMRLSVDNIGNQASRLERRFFTPNRLPGGAFSSSEFRESTYGPPVTFTVSGSF